MGEQFAATYFSIRASDGGTTAIPQVAQPRYPSRSLPRSSAIPGRKLSLLWIALDASCGSTHRPEESDPLVFICPICLPAIFTSTSSLHDKRTVSRASRSIFAISVHRNHSTVSSNNDIHAYTIVAQRITQRGAPSLGGIGVGK